MECTHRDGRYYRNIIQYIMPKVLRYHNTSLLKALKKFEHFL